MKKVEDRKVTVLYCDGCNTEQSHLEHCGCCNKDYCMADGGNKHFAYAVEIYRYNNTDRRNTHICLGCAAINPGGTTGHLLNTMMSQALGPVVP